MAVGVSSFCGVLSPRTATFIIAALGILIHIQLYCYLGTLRSSLPDVPERPYTIATTLQSSPYGSAARLDQLAGILERPGLGQDATDAARIAADAGAASKTGYRPEWVAEAEAYLKAQGLEWASGGGVRAVTEHGSVSQPQPPSLLPPPPMPPGPSGRHGYHFDDGAEDAERLNWHTLRLVLSAFRIYAFASILCCVAGVVGVLRPHLVLTRIFVIHYFLDLLFTTLSLGSAAVVSTYPSIRSQICDEYGTGQVVSFLPSSESHSGRHASPPSPREAAAAAGSGGTDASPSSWETMLDGILTSENCEEAFTSTLLPLFLLGALAYTAVKLHAFLCVQRFYSSLLRSKMVQFGYYSPLSSSALSSTSTLLWGRRWSATSAGTTSSSGRLTGAGTPPPAYASAGSEEAYLDSPIDVVPMWETRTSTKEAKLLD